MAIRMAMGRAAALVPRPALATTTKGAVPRYPHAALFSTTTPSSGSAGMRRSIEKSLATQDRSGLKGSAHLQAQAQAEYLRNGGTPLFTGTVITSPFSKWPSHPRQVLRYLRAIFTTKLAAKVSIWNMVWQSLSRRWRPEFKHNKRQIPATAQALYREILEAFAAGDTATISRVAVPNYAQKLCAAIEKRDPREKVSFEILKYHRPWSFPRVKTSIIHNLNESTPWELHHQAVVAIDSTQQVTRLDRATGQTIPGSAKIQRKVEYVVLAREVDKRTWECTPWKVWGTTSDTPLPVHEQQMKMLNESQERVVNFKKMKRKP